MAIDLRANPFYLDDEGIAWVENTLASLTEDEKIQQLFFPCLFVYDEKGIDEMLSKIHPAGVMLRPASAREDIQAVELFRRKSKIPMLFAANLEKGGNGGVTEGTVMGCPMALSATPDYERNARRMGTLCAREGSAVGINWAFAPIIDIDYNYRNPITNTRTFGSDPEKVLRWGRAYTEECQKLGVAVSIKHFPGDGRDDRDQHLVTSVNDLDCESWMETYGAAYKASIEAGAMTVMVGHIMQPAWTRRLNPEIRDENMLPGSLSKELMTGLLRGELGFNGVIVTDASTMAGITIPLPRRLAVPTAIAAGADIFLFSRNMVEDLEYMRSGVAEGIVSRERLDEAVTRTLALKAALGLHKPQKPLDPVAALKVLGCEEHQRWADEVASDCITLVKEQPGVLPLDPAKKRVLFCPIESAGGVKGTNYALRSGVCEEFKGLLEREGFEVTEFVPDTTHEGGVTPSAYFESHYDYIIYLACMATKSNQTAVRIEWQQPMGANCPHYINSIPTIFISVENPYHLQDVPRVKTFINAYYSDSRVLKALVEKLMGRDSFRGTSPIDPFCGKWDARL